ncbi:MAG: cyoC, partial [Chthoniobacteraceae bacterium]|nr:cyoC [Chthoniobacteraceae bacterium]
MQIPHEVTARPDTGLYNAKLGIWLFLASEVMLFGGLFSGYIFLRLGAEPGYWPHGLLNVPVGTFNTAVLILSSVTVVLAWASLKMRQFSRYKLYMGITILCGILFLVVKLAYEYPQKFTHFGVFIKKDALGKYEQYLGNQHLAALKLDPRVEISGHLLDAPKGSHYEKVAQENAEHFRHLLHEGGA